MTILIKNMMTLPISIQQNIKQFVPSIVWNNPEFSNRSNLVYTKYLSDHKEMSDSNWDALMSEIKVLSIRSKKQILHALQKR